MQQADEIRLFPTSIWTMELNDCNDFNLNFQKYIYDLKSQSEDHIERSNKGGWHSPNLDYNKIDSYGLPKIVFDAERFV